MQKVFFHTADKSLKQKNKKQLKTFIERLFKNEKMDLERIDYIFCSDNYLLQLNISALNHDYYTDILTFPLSKPDQPIKAEVYISLDRVKENAKTFNEKVENETLRVIFHGALHLCGYNDHSELEKREIRNKENYYISSYLINVSRETLI